MNKLEKLLSSLNNLKSETEGLHIGKLKTTLSDLNKLNNVMKYEIAKKNVYDELVKKINTTDTSKLVKKL